VFLKYLQPSIEVFSIRIDEPITTVTDLLLAGICFFAFYRIRLLESSVKIKWYFKYYFLCLGLGALFGGLFGHAFMYGLSPTWKLVSWLFVLASVALISHAMVLMARPLMRPSVSRFVGLSNLGIMFLALIYTVSTIAFTVVQFYIIFAMVVVVGSMSYLIYRRTGSRGVVLLMMAVAVGLLSSLVFSYKWGLSPWFNHNDISHVILTLSAFGIYKGAVVLIETPLHIL
jgi:hypothetical protein